MASDSRNASRPSIHPKQPGNWGSEEQGVDQIEDTAKATQHLARVFGTEFPLDERLSQVAGHAGNADEQAVANPAPEWLERAGTAEERLFKDEPGRQQRTDN